MDVDHTAESLSAVAALIRATYIRERQAFESRRTRDGGVRYRPGPQWDGGVTARGHSRKPVWPQIAQYVIRQRLDPVEFVRAQFVCNHGHAPQPNMLLSGKAVDNYEKGSQITTDELTTAFKFQQRLCRLEVRELYQNSDWSEADVWATVLLNEGLAMTALFRYCAAVKMKLAIVAERYHAAAAVQYVYNSGLYDRIWGKWIPRKFRDQAEAIYLAVNRQGEA